MKNCTKCLEIKKLSEFPKSKRYKDGYNCICKSCINIINKSYRINNKDSFSNSRKEHYQRNILIMRKLKRDYYSANKNKKSLYGIEYRILNKDKIVQYKSKWELINRNKPIFKIKRNLRRRVHHALKGNNKSAATFNLIGCNPHFFKLHIESQFAKGMTWNNYGAHWHIDHIVPCFNFDLSIKEEQEKCFHYLNQRPLWKLDNLRRPRNT